ncbi:MULTISPECIES: 50S ribosomal protein L24 [unclassified Fibrobacter]|uniref:50S ribosomal protein L24 n=1 Tax=unclassified Fibrobacter TaxID=2634177 RepID=UPI00091E2131|nr:MULTISPECIES: 50S ribosomal protein L24 [unclassified Fibrobacter]SHK94932.1 large subunit ribosomal protein L24 [Fibrobacter sp. UWB12]SIO34035.1 large subunit ribosomal protein L24 [Fibrobacter sp. UWB11]
MANIKKNDIVKVISGANKKTGTVISVKGDKVTVSGVNVRKRHEKPSQTNQTGGIVEKEMPIHISNVMLLEGNTPVRTRIVREKGKKGVRTSVKTGKAV